MRREFREGLGFAEPLARRLGSPASCNPAPRKQNRTPPPRLLRAAAGAVFHVGENEKGGGADWSFRGTPPTKLNSLSIMSVEEQVKSHTQQVDIGEPVRYGEGCPDCFNSNSESFHVHDCRPRTFRLIVAGCVKIFRSGIWRWVCGPCGRRFTDYPRLPCRTNAL